VDRITSYAQTAGGQHYRSLANYLFSPYQRNVAGANHQHPVPIPTNAGEAFVTAYIFQEHGPPQPRSFSNVEDFLQIANEAEDASVMIFLRGCQPPELLNAIGGKYRIDPEFFRQHLDAKPQLGDTAGITMTHLPSGGNNVVQLPSITLGSRCSTSGLPQIRHQTKLSNIRAETTTRLDDHVNKFSQARHLHMQQGSSMVRDFSVHNYQYFSLEQEITIYVAAHGKGWIAIVWLDIGCDLSHDREGPWQPKALQCESWEIQFHPTIQHRPGAALDSWHLPRSNTIPRTSNERDYNRLFQSAALLHKNYGHHLDNQTMTADPLYALTDVFVYTASTTAQFLDLMQLCLDREFTPSLLSRYSLSTKAALHNLVYNRLILDRHLRRLRATYTFLENRTQAAAWPTAATPSTQEISARAADKLLMDYSHLTKRCDALCTAFDNTMDMLQNNAMIEESHKAIEQAEGVANLTRLAFFFIPLSFTASVYGMNIKQFTNDASLSIWVWIVTSAITLVVSYLVLSWGNWHLAERLAHVKPKKQRQKPRDPETTTFEVLDISGDKD
jgi:hypothetical protein